MDKNPKAYMFGQMVGSLGIWCMDSLARAGFVYMVYWLLT